MPTILAVDDSTSLRQMLSHTLQASGFEVLQAHDGLDALEQLQARPADLVITDQNMPRLDGLGLTRALRADPRWHRLPVLILTTDSDSTLKAAAREAGATGWLAKPFDPVRLVAVIGQVLA